MITREASWIESLGVFIYHTKWALLMGVTVYLLCYRIVGKPNTLFRQFVLLSVIGLMVLYGPITLFDVFWVSSGGPRLAVYSVYPTLYGDMVPLFFWCGLIFYIFYCGVFWLIPFPWIKVKQTASEVV